MQSKSFKRTIYKYVLIDEFGDPIRRFATKQEATPFLTNGSRLNALPKQPSDYELAMSLCGEALI